MATITITDDRETETVTVELDGRIAQKRCFGAYVRLLRGYDGAFDGGRWTLEECGPTFAERLRGEIASAIGARVYEHDVEVVRGEGPSPS